MPRHHQYFLQSCYNELQCILYMIQVCHFYDTPCFHEEWKLSCRNLSRDMELPNVGRMTLQSISLLNYFTGLETSVWSGKRSKNQPEKGGSSCPWKRSMLVSVHVYMHNHDWLHFNFLLWCTDGHALAVRLARRITVVSSQLKALISQHNQLAPIEAQKLTWESANDLNAHTSVVYPSHPSCASISEEGVMPGCLSNWSSKRWNHNGKGRNE